MLHQPARPLLLLGEMYGVSGRKYARVFNVAEVTKSDIVGVTCE